MEGIGASRMRVTKNDAQTIANNTTTIVEYNNEEFDNLGEYDDVTNHRFTATEAGYYSVSASVMSEDVDWDPVEYWIIYIYKNEAPISVGNRSGVSAAVKTYRQAQVKDIIYLAANDYIDIRVRHVQGDPVNLYPSSQYNYFSVHRLSK